MIDGRKVAYIICEFTGTVRDEFEKAGWDAWSCDFLPCERGGKHFQMDCRNLDYTGVDLVIAHPDCTYITNSGVTWLHKQPDRWLKMVEAALFLKWCLELPVDRLCVENPIPHKYALEIIGRKYDQLIQPYQFGHLETNATCLWLKGLPKLIPTSDLREETFNQPDNVRQRLHYLPPSPTRKQDRSRTFLGIAKAVAEQWG